MQAGINLPIVIAGELAGVIGITGAPEEVGIFGEIIKRMTEILLENLRQQEQADLLAQARNLFVETWLFDESVDWTQVELRGRQLGLDLARRPRPPRSWGSSRAASSCGGSGISCRRPRGTAAPSSGTGFWCCCRTAAARRAIA